MTMTQEEREYCKKMIEKDAIYTFNLHSVETGAHQAIKQVTPDQPWGHAPQKIKKNNTLTLIKKIIYEWIVLSIIASSITGALWIALNI